MKTLFAILALAVAGFSQSPLYVRDSAPAPVIVTNCTNATPIVCTTALPHGFGTNCTHNSNPLNANVCLCAPWGVTTGTGRSPVNNTKECSTQAGDGGDTTHFALFDLTGNPVAGTGAYFPSQALVGFGGITNQWVGLVKPFTTVANPNGELDGPNGSTMRRLSLSPSNGMTSVIITGGAGGVCTSTPCIATVTTSYDPTLSTYPNFPLSPGDNVSFTGTNTAFDTCGWRSGTLTTNGTTATWVSGSKLYYTAGLTININGSNYTISSTDNTGKILTLATSAGVNASPVAFHLQENTAQAAYTVGSVTSSTIVTTAFTCSGLATGDYTNINLNCGLATGTVNTSGTAVTWASGNNFARLVNGGPLVIGGTTYYISAVNSSTSITLLTSAGSNTGATYTAYDVIAGSQTCTRMSQLATSAGQWWVQGIIFNYARTVTTSPQYKYVNDGGTQTPDTGVEVGYGFSAIRYLVDPTVELYLDTIIYGLNHPENIQGVTFFYNEAFGANDAGEPYSPEWTGLAQQYDAALPMWAPAEEAIFRDKILSNIDDPTTTACTKSNNDVSTVATHNWVISSGNVAVGTNSSTQVQLQAGGCIPGTYVQLANYGGGGINQAGTSWGVVASCSSDDATVSQPFAATPTRENLTGTPLANGVIDGGTVTSTAGLTISGYGGAMPTTGQNCAFTVSGFGSTQNAEILVPLTSLGAIANGTHFSIYLPGEGFTSSPTSATATGVAPGTAVCSGSITISASVGTPYTVFDTVTISDTTSIHTAVVTFTASTVAGTINVGDEIMANNQWPQYHAGAAGSIVTMVGSGTCATTNSGNVSLTSKQLCVVNLNGPSASSTPQKAWRMIKYSAGDCGAWWQLNHCDGHDGDGANPIDFPTWDGPGMNTTSGPIPVIGNLGTNNPGDMIHLDLVMMNAAVAASDFRAQRDISMRHSFLYDYWEGQYCGYLGWMNIGPAYSYDGLIGQFEFNQWIMSQTLGTSYTTCAFTDPSQQFTFDTLPGDLTFPGWAGGMPSGLGLFAPQGTGSSLMRSFQYAPNSNAAGFARNFLERFPSVGAYQPTDNFWSGYGVPSGSTTAAFLHNDPRVVDLDFTVQPHQYVWNSSNLSQCNSLFGGGICALARGDYMVSNTGWLNLTASQYRVDCRTYLGQYDSPSGCRTWFYLTSPLLGTDSAYSGGSLWVSDTTILADAIRFGNPAYGYGNEFDVSGSAYNNLCGTASCSVPTPILSWGEANAGTLGSNYGDQNSNYVYWSAAVGQAYNPSLVNVAYANRSGAELKVSGHDHFIFKHDDISAQAAGGGNIAMNEHEHYNQTGGQINMAFVSTLVSGLTTVASACTSGGCTPKANTALASGDIIVSKEGNTMNNAGRPPVQTFGIMTSFFSPNTIYGHWDCPAINVTVTGATNASPIVISAINSFYSGDAITLAGVGGNTAANGTFIVGSASGTQFTLIGSSGNGAYTSGGTATSYQCNLFGNTYPNGQGYSDRVEIGAGAAPGATTEAKTTWTICHKVMGSLTDTTYTAQTLAPNANWSGCAIKGNLSAGIFLQADGNTTYSSIPKFTYVSAVPVDIIMGGLTPGTYTLTVGGTQVFSGLVAAGDTSIYATATGGGVVSLSQTGAVGGPFLNGAVKIGGSFTIGR